MTERPDHPVRNEERYQTGGDYLPPDVGSLEQLFLLKGILASEECGLEHDHRRPPATPAARPGNTVNA